MKFLHVKKETKNNKTIEITTITPMPSLKINDLIVVNDERNKKVNKFYIADIKNTTHFVLKKRNIFRAWYNAIKQIKLIFINMGKIK